jgi:ATP phosphoribosyltransferase
MAANGKIGLMLNAPKDKLDEIVKIFPPGKKPTVSELSDSKWVAINVILEEKLVRDFVPDLKKVGAQDIVEYPLNKIIH